MASDPFLCLFFFLPWEILMDLLQRWQYSLAILLAPERLLMVWVKGEASPHAEVVWYLPWNGSVRATRHTSGAASLTSFNLWEPNSHVTIAFKLVKLNAKFSRDILCAVSPNRISMVFYHLSQPGEAICLLIPFVFFSDMTLNGLQIGLHDTSSSLSVCWL